MVCFGVERYCLAGWLLNSLEGGEVLYLIARTVEFGSRGLYQISKSIVWDPLLDYRNAYVGIGTFYNNDRNQWN